MAGRTTVVCTSSKGCGAVPMPILKSRKVLPSFAMSCLPRHRLFRVISRHTTSERSTGSNARYSGRLLSILAAVSSRPEAASNKNGLVAIFLDRNPTTATCQTGVSLILAAQACQPCLLGRGVTYDFLCQLNAGLQFSLIGTPIKEAIDENGQCNKQSCDQNCLVFHDSSTSSGSGNSRRISQSFSLAPGDDS